MLITQGKTNITYLLIVIIIATVVGGGVFVFLKVPSYQSVEVEVPEKVQQISRKSAIYKFFPNFFNAPRKIFSDPKDPNFIWLSGVGGVLEYNLEEGKINKIIAGSDGVHMVPRSIAIIDNTLFISFQGGFKKINLITKESRTYREEDGLVNGANVYLFPDPYDKEIIWIGTFRGLSKFNIKDETFINFQKEIGIVGNGSYVGGDVLVNANVRVGKNFVWLIGSANAYSEGGVARYDKINNTWKSWGPESFGKTGRVDFSGFDIDENRAFVIGPSRNIFEYKPNTDSWEVITKRETSAFKSHLVYSVNRVYFIEHTDEKVIKYINLPDYSLHSLKISKFTDIYNDISHKRLILFNSLEANDKIIILKPETNEQKIVMLDINKEYKFTDIVGVYQNLIFFKSGKDLYIYNRNLDNLTRFAEILIGYSNQTIKVINNKLVLVDIPIEEFGGPPPNRSISIISLENFNLETKATIEGFFNKAMIGNSLSEIYFVKQFQNDTVVYKFSTDAIQDSELILENLETVDPSILDPPKVEDYSIISTTNNNNSLTVEAKKSVNGDTISVNFYHKDKPSITKTFSLGRRYHNPFGWSPKAEVTNIKFSKTNPEILWIGTNRGLIRYDTKTYGTKLFTTESGLASNSIEELFIDNQIIIGHPIGTYIYFMDLQRD